MTTYLIIGNGVAGNAAAENLRKLDRESSIVLFSRESRPFYYVPALPEYLAGERPLNRLIIHDLDWYRQNRLELHLDTVISRIDPDRKMVATAGGDEFSYDKLLLANGGNSFVPPLKGAETPGVFTLKTLADADKIKDWAARAHPAILIGGGLLGLEAGNGLRKAGLQVTVVEIFPRLLPRQMDEAGAALLQKQLEAMGFTFHLGAKTREISPCPEGLIVSREEGEPLTGGLVLVSAGVRPDLTLARAAGLETDKGIKVDDAMRTSRPDIYAAGDCIEHRGRLYGIWPAALEQGKVAGAAMAGQKVSYEGTLPSNVLKVAGIDLLSAGEIDVEGQLEDLIQKDEARYLYRKLVIKDSRLVGAILLNDLRGSTEIQAAIRQQKDISAVKKDLASVNFDFKRLTS